MVSSFDDKQNALNEREIANREYDNVVKAKRTINVDRSNRSSLSSLFGETITGERIANVSGQFVYGIPTSAATPETINGGSVSVVEAMLVLSTGTNPAGKASIQNKRSVRYIPGYDTWSNFTTTFTTGATVQTGVPDSVQRGGLYTTDDGDGFFVGFEGETFYFTRRRDGVDTNYSVDLDKLNHDYGSTVDFRQMQVWRINYGYLGGAPIILEVLSPKGEWVNVLTVEYPNSSSDVSILNTFLTPKAEVYNEGNTTDIVMKVGSFAGGIVDGGGFTPSSRPFGYGNKTPLTVGTTSTNLIAFQNKTTFNSRDNYVPWLLTLISYATAGTKPFRFTIYKNPTFSGTPTWIDRDADDSITQYATANIATSSLGSEEFTFYSSKDGRDIVPVKDQRLELLPGDVFLVEAQTSSVAGEGNISFRWEEQF